MDMESENPDSQQQQQQQSQQLSSTTNELEMDAGLLQQFRCLGTTDHEDLINELITLMNNEINHATAKFFLEMCNWNIQSALCCYFDYSNFVMSPCVKVVQHMYLSDCSQLWKLKNDGIESWPSGCYLMSPSQTKKIELPTVAPNETFNIIADIPPTSPATKWTFCTKNGYSFGETIWMKPFNSEDPTTDLAQRLAQLHTTSSSDRSMNYGNSPQVTTSSSAGSMNDDNPPQINVMVVMEME